MQIWVDGDACPKAIKEIIFRAAIKRKIPAIVVANHFIAVPPSPFIKRIQVSFGFDKADKYIAAHLCTGNLVVTADIILADIVIAASGLALNPRGMLYTSSNIKQTLAMRNLNEVLRESGAIKGGVAPLSPKEIQAFANHLDRYMTAMQGSVKSPKAQE